jgi:hypothetical protein
MCHTPSCDHARSYGSGSSTNYRFLFNVFSKNTSGQQLLVEEEMLRLSCIEDF